ncbi:anti-sigma factor [Arthrobacter cryoconiti]|uniref:Regulator of SigK n=1 Tax=Arthrobacter cryoconiti TaxID=748907 RepID=A0ABV8R1B6_9MICC|nr:anti-sigma factor [Arthrobacter cryoconiti]MCC9068294.1 anti-sigma factor [Arthrobacter cryoconiti]
MEEQMHSLTGAYALDALTDSERELFESLLHSDPQVQEEVRSLSETAALLAFGAPAVKPPAAMKANIMATIAKTPQLPATAPATATATVHDISSARSSRASTRSRQQHSKWFPALSVAASLAVLAGVGVGGWAMGHSAGQENTAQNSVAEQSAQNELLAIMGAPDAKIATTTVGDHAVVTIAASAQANKASIMVKDMPAAPSGKSYELWFISANGAVPAGLMTETPSGNSVQTLQGAIDGATHIGITVEPLGGSASPTTTPILVQAI